LDRVFSEPILKSFEQNTGIRVRPLFDVEASKTTGLVNRLIAEKSNPQADVFWNSEIMRTIHLKRMGILQRYASSAAKDIPANFKDSDGYWTGFAARARVLIYNKNLLKKEEVPISIFQLTQNNWKNDVALANPLFGTTATHMAALYELLGEKKAVEYWDQLENNIVLVLGNSTSRDMVQSGEIKIGFTDTDDVWVSLANKKPVGYVYPDQNGIGTLLIPNTVSLIKDGPNSTEGKILIDYLLSKEIESALAFSGSGQMPLRQGVKCPDDIPDFYSIRLMDVDFEKVADNMEESIKHMKDIFVH